MSGDIKKFSDELNSDNSDIEQFDEPTDIKIGQVLAAPFEDDPNELTFYRAKVVRITVDNGHIYSFKVHITSSIYALHTYALRYIY